MTDAHPPTATPGPGPAAAHAPGTGRSDGDAGDPACWAHLTSEAFDEAGVPTDDLLARLVRRLADAVIVCDPAGRIVLWNDAATRLFGFDAAEALGNDLDLIIPERQRRRHWDGWREVMRTGHTQYGTRLLEVPATHRDGHRLSIAFTVTLLTVAGQDAPVGIAAVVRDQTEQFAERRRIAAELAELRRGDGEGRTAGGDAPPD